jgi:hypothetical protein
MEDASLDIRRYLLERLERRSGMPDAHAEGLPKPPRR